MTQLAGQITVATPGTSVQGPNVPLTGGVIIEALSTNTGSMWLAGASGDNRLTGFEIPSGDKTVFSVFNLAELWFDSSVAGGKISWMKL